METAERRGGACMGFSERSVSSCEDLLVGLVVKASGSRAEDPGFDSRLQRDFSGVSDSKIVTPVATVPVAWRYRVNAGTV